ncbi:hypothetical protein ACUV7Z_002798 [Listeria monocytogenes]
MEYGKVRKIMECDIYKWGEEMKTMDEKVYVTQKMIEDKKMDKSCIKDIY